jgi:hypothetical protein
MRFDIPTGGQAGIDWTNLITVQRIPKEWPWVDVAELKDWAGDILRVIVEDGWLKSNISSGSIYIRLDWKVAHLFERVVVYDRFRLPPPPTFIPSVSSFEAPALMRHRAYATTETAISRRADNPWFTSHTKATAVAVEAASSVNAMQMPGQAARLIYIADAQVMQALSTDGEETFSVAATGLTGYKHVEALELPFDARMLLLLYRESDGQWLQSLGRFDAAASQYVEWVPPVATGLFGADARGSLKRLADGQVAFSYIDSENEVQVVRCTAVKYDATGEWA